MSDATPASTDTWPDSDEVRGKCPCCGHVDIYSIEDERVGGHSFKPVDCHACHCEYLIVAAGGKVSVEPTARNARSFTIQHRYDIGDQAVTVEAPVGLDVRRAAVFVQFQAETCFGQDKAVTNLGIAAALVAFYGCVHAPRNRYGQLVDMYWDRERMCAFRIEVMSDPDLKRDGLKAFLAHHIDGGLDRESGVRKTPAVYVASRASIPERPTMWKALRAQGAKIVSSWIDEAGPGETGDFGELWLRIENEIRSADRLVLYVELQDLPLKGAYVEVGMALGMGKPVLVVVSGMHLKQPNLNPLGSWANHPGVSFATDLRDAVGLPAAEPAAV